jgi:phage terminase large subunit-like protein
VKVFFEGFEKKGATMGDSHKFAGKSEEGRQHQQNNLNRTGKKNYYLEPDWKSELLQKMEERKLKQAGNRFLRAKRALVEPPSLNNPEYANDIIKFANEQFFIETRRPIQIERWQEEKILKPLFSKQYHLGVISLCKKDGKSTLGAIIALHKLLYGPDFSEIYLLASDLDQITTTIFSKIVRCCELNHRMLSRLSITQDTITYDPRGSFIKVLPSEYKGSFGSNAALVIFDELWTYDQERARRLYEAYTENPTRPDFLVLVFSHAGYSRDSLLFELYEIGMGKNKPDDYFFLWSHENLASWKTKEFLKRQRNKPGMRSNLYKRLYENRWTEEEDSFIDEQELNRCIKKDLRPTLPNKEISIYVGIDASVSSDTSVVAAVTKTIDKIRLVCYRIWKPSKAKKMDLEATIADYLKELNSGYLLRKAYYDPFQLHQTMLNLKNEGIAVEELPQSQNNVIAYSQLLYELIHYENLEVFEDKNIKEHFRNASFKESPQGFRLMKRGKGKIDICAALGMASLAAVGTKEIRPGRVYIADGSNDEMMEEEKHIEKEPAVANVGRIYII